MLRQLGVLLYQPDSKLIEHHPPVETLAPGAAGVAGVGGAERTVAVVVEVKLGVGSGFFPIEVEREQAGGHVAVVAAGGDEQMGCVGRHININERRAEDGGHKRRTVTAVGADGSPESHSAAC